MNDYASRIDTALVHLAAGDAVTAEALCRAVLLEAPTCADAWHGLACVARHAKQPRLAITSVAHALGLAKSDGEKARFHITLAAALDEAGHLREAVSACRVAILLEPRDFRGKAFLAELLYRSEFPDDAATEFREALSLAADPVPLLVRHGSFLMEQRFFPAAVRVFSVLVSLCPHHAHAHANLGAAHFESGSMPAALTSLQKALALEEPGARTLNNLGLVYQSLGVFDQAEEAFSRALALSPDDAVIANNRATFYVETGRQDDAERFFRCAAAGESDVARQARFNLSIIQLARGEYSEGWANFEYRRSVCMQDTDQALWQGQVTEKRVRIEAEQGLGDNIQFLRFLPQAAERAPILLMLPEPLKPLIAFMPALRRFLDSGRITLQGEAALKASLLSLPYLLGTTQIDASPYLDLGVSAEVGRIGLFRAGSPGYRFDARRSLPSEMLEPILAVEGYSFVNLQQGDTPSCMVQGVGETLLNTAFAMAKCEIVIGVDTMMAHLAGAAGLDLWLLDRWGGDWRWLGPDWYARTRIFRSEAGLVPAEAWPLVIERVVQALRGRSGRKAQA